jgi:Ser/Thr protein kinase RdoA (MazF antagonist)
LLILSQGGRFLFYKMQKVYSYEIGVVHSDFRPNNMVILPQENKLGLIDFEDIILDVKHYDIAKYLGAFRNRCLNGMKNFETTILISSLIKKRIIVEEG